MPKHDFEFEIYPQGDYSVINIAKGYDHEINLSITHDANWWVYLMRINDEYHLDIQIGHHNTVLMEVNRDGCRGVDEDRLEVKPIGLYRVDLLAMAVKFVKEYETRLIYAMEALYQDANKA